MSEHLLSTEQVCASYDELRARVSDLMRSISTQQAQTVVPHCPQWTVKDCLAHIIGVPEDVMNGQMDGVATDAWTDRQVQRHKQDSVDDLLAVWETNAPIFGKILPNIPQPILSQFMFDQTTHEHDIRAALGKPGARESMAVAVAEGFLRDSLSRNSDLAIVRLADHKLTGFEFLRSLSGRRSRNQISHNGFNIKTVETFIDAMPFDIPESDVSDD
ncbi:MAG: hypothetical protein RLZZ426_83 [Actinomycetota bacterium]|jgi:uncharacterized protein (TIGR03083 family)